MRYDQSQLKPEQKIGAGNLALKVAQKGCSAQLTKILYHAKNILTLACLLFFYGSISDADSEGWKGDGRNRHPEKLQSNSEDGRDGIPRHHRKDVGCETRDRG